MSLAERLFAEPVDPGRDLLRSPRPSRVLRPLTGVLPTGLLFCALCVAAGCDDESALDTQALAPTAIAWIESPGPGDVWGRAVFVEREIGQEQVDFELLMEGLDPGRYAVRLRSIDHCDDPREDSADLLEIAIEAEGRAAVDHRSQLERLDLDEQGPLVGGSVVVEIADGYEAGEPVGCGVIEYLGVLSEESRGRWQGPRPTP